MQPGGGFLRRWHPRMWAGALGLALVFGIGNPATSDQAAAGGGSPASSFIWVANSGEGTVSKIDARTGLELGRYRSAPESRGSFPTRIAADSTGSAWVGNHQSATVTKIGLLETGNCVDRNGNGTIETSTGQSDVRPWVVDPADECILLHVVLPPGKGHGVGLVVVDGAGNPYVGAHDSGWLHHLDGQTGSLLKSWNNRAGHNYDGAIDPEGNLWIGTGEAKRLIRFDLATEELRHIQLPHFITGIAVDTIGHTWASGDGPHSGFVSKVQRGDSAILGTYATGGRGSQGAVAAANGDIWVTNAGSDSVSRLGQDGTLKSIVDTGSAPIAATIDVDGRVWTTNSVSGDTTRVDPETSETDTFPVGQAPVDAVSVIGATPPDCDPVIPGLTWLSPLSSDRSYGLPIDGKLLIRFRWGTCSNFIHDESVIISIQDPLKPTLPVTTWVYTWDIAIDDQTGEYRQEFIPAFYHLNPGTELAVQVFIGHALVGQAPIQIVQ